MLKQRQNNNLKTAILTFKIVDLAYFYHATMKQYKYICNHEI